MPGGGPRMDAGGLHPPFALAALRFLTRSFDEKSATRAINRIR